MATHYARTDGATGAGSRTKGSASAAAAPHGNKRAQSTHRSGREGSVRLTHEQIEERAKLIWKQRGCTPGEDDRNWYEAETQLKQELSTK
jgi:hypothetical protein